MAGHEIGNHLQSRQCLDLLRHLANHHAGLDRRRHLAVAHHSVREVTPE